MAFIPREAEWSTGSLKNPEIPGSRPALRLCVCGVARGTDVSDLKLKLARGSPPFPSTICFLQEQT